jgi:hypothetical protein
MFMLMLLSSCPISWSCTTHCENEFEPSSGYIDFLSDELQSQVAYQWSREEKLIYAGLPCIIIHSCACSLQINPRKLGTAPP